MVVVIAYCHRDAVAALRLLRWIAFLADESGRAPRLKCLLVPSPLATWMDIAGLIVRAADAAFPAGVTVFKPRLGEEHGWPRSCNEMFGAALVQATERMREDMLWLEPDAAPVRTDWLEAIEAEWRQTQTEGKSFLGCYVPKAKPHLSGNAVYGRDWRSLAPSLGQISNEAWDSRCGAAILPHARLTALFQQVWHPRQVGLRSLKSGTAIYHQDKAGALILELDKSQYGGRFSNGKGDMSDATAMKIRYYRASNATRTLQIANYKFLFVPTGLQAGAMGGVYQTSNPGEQAVLRHAGHLGITEISEERYRLELKKKERMEHLSGFDPYRRMPSGPPRRLGVVAPAEAAEPVKPEPAPTEIGTIELGPVQVGEGNWIVGRKPGG
jgi:hypothetical protein